MVIQDAVLEAAYCDDLIQQQEAALRHEETNYCSPATAQSTSRLRLTVTHKKIANWLADWGPNSSPPKSLRNGERAAAFDEQNQHKIWKKNDSPEFGEPSL